MSTTPHDPDRVLIFDTTLRDGEQSPGISLNTAEKLEIAHQLARLNVDIIEAGFPIASPGDFEAVQSIAREVEGPVIAGLARANPGDVERAWEAVRDSARPRIHTFVSTSDIHIEHQLQATREDVKGLARASVAQAGALGGGVGEGEAVTRRVARAVVPGVALAEGQSDLHLLGIEYPRGAVQYDVEIVDRACERCAPERGQNLGHENLLGKIRGIDAGDGTAIQRSRRVTVIFLAGGSASFFTPSVSVLASSRACCTFAEATDANSAL